MTTIWTALASLKDVCRHKDVKNALYQVTSTDTRMQTTHKGEKGTTLLQTIFRQTEAGTKSHVDICKKSWLLHPADTGDRVASKRRTRIRRLQDHRVGSTVCSERQRQNDRHISQRDGKNKLLVLTTLEKIWEENTTKQQTEKKSICEPQKSAHQASKKLPTHGAATKDLKRQPQHNIILHKQQQTRERIKASKLYLPFGRLRRKQAEKSSSLQSSPDGATPTSIWQ